MSKPNIKYANCWEDAYLLEKFMEVENRSVLSIASGGDNSLYLLKSKPKRMICIDYNPSQLFVTELKANAMQHLNKEDCLSFLGIIVSQHRLQMFESFSHALSDGAREYWSSNLHLIKNGIIHQGKFERYFRIFHQRLLPLVRSPKIVNELLRPKTIEEQQIGYHKNWFSWQWRMLFRGFFNKTTMSRLGRDPEKFNEVEGEVEKILWQRTENHFQSKLCQDNYMLDYILTGEYLHLPPYLEHFDDCKAWLQQNQIEYFLGDLNQALQKFPNCDRFNLSNIFEYMTEAQFAQHQKQLVNLSADKSRYCYWNLLVPRLMENDKILHQVDTERELDRGFFYDEFYCYEKK